MVKKGTYYKRKAAGVCVGCLAPRPKNGTVRCEACTIKKRQADLKYIELNKNRGKCIVCYAKINENETKCKKCILRLRKFSNNVYYKRKEAGVCVSCGKDREKDSKTTKCKKCKNKEKIRRKGRNKNEEENVKTEEKERIEIKN